MNDNDPELEDAAALWFARMDGENAAQYRASFDAWFEQAPKHRDAWTRIARVHRDAGILHLARARARQPRGIPRGKSLTVLRSPIAHRRWVARAAMVVGLVMSAAVLEQLFEPQLSRIGMSTAAQAHLILATPLREIRSFRLPDGTSVTLDAASRIEVDFTPTDRVVHMVSGRALFRIGQDPRRFSVIAGNSAVVARAADLEIAIGDGPGVSINLLGGGAALHSSAPLLGHLIPARELHIDQPVAVTGYWPHVTSADEGHINRTGWPNGWVDCRSITLGDLIAEANRYSLRPIVLDTPGLAAMTTTGRFRVAASDTFVRDIATEFDLSVRNAPDGVHLTPK